MCFTRNSQSTSGPVTRMLHLQLLDLPQVQVQRGARQRAGQGPAQLQAAPAEG